MRVDFSPLVLRDVPFRPMTASALEPEPTPPLRILFATSEAAPFAKTGGLGDVAGSLPRALAERGHECIVIMPLYQSCRRSGFPLEPTPHSFTVSLGGRRIETRLCRSRLPDSSVAVYFVEQPEFFERDDPASGAGIYQYRDAAQHMADYADNGERFIYFCLAVLDAVRRIGFVPDVVHANDWQTGLLAALLHAGKASALAGCRTLFTIHNLAYQGNVSKALLPLTGLGWEYFTLDRLEFYDRLSLLKAGIVFSDAVNTVSPRYAQEIQTPEFGYGMDGILRHHREKLSGIVNGVDYREWDPAVDRRLPVNYSIDTVAQGKAANKAELQRYLRLPPVPSIPLVGMITRLAEQKGLDLVQAAAGDLMRENIQFVVLGTGEAHYQAYLASLARRHPSQVSVVLEFNTDLAHLIEAGSDIFLMPSRFEPCGLNQLYSLRYGTLPVARETGGLADTITDASEANLAARTATGFLFRPYDAEALLSAVRRALRMYEAQPGTWRQMQRTGMAQDWSWDRSAREYEKLYRKTPR